MLPCIGDFVGVSLVAVPPLGTLGVLSFSPLTRMNPEVKDELSTLEEGQEVSEETVEVVESAAVLENTEELQDEVSDGVAAVIPMVKPEADDEEVEQERAPAMAEAA